MDKQDNKYNVEIEISESLIPSWRESTYCKFVDLVISEDTELQYEFAHVLDRKIVGLHTHLVDEEGIFRDLSHCFNKSNILLNTEQLGWRLVNIVGFNGTPDETAKAIRAGEFYATHNRKPNFKKN